MEHFVDTSKAPFPSAAGSGAEAVSFAPIKKLPTSASVGLSSVPVTDRGNEAVNVSFSDFGAGVGSASGRLLRLALDRRAHACRDCVLTQAHR
jgi:hypothetical protein